MIDRRQFAFGVAAAGAAIASPAVLAQTPTVLRIAGNFASDHSSSIAMMAFKKEVEEVSKGAIVIEVFDNMQLGGAQGERRLSTRAGTVFA